MASTNLTIAWTHLASRFKQTLVAVLSVTFGISMYIFMNSFMSGVNETQNELAFSTLAHVRVYNDLPGYNPDFGALEEDGKYWVHVSNPRSIQYTTGIKDSRKVMATLEDRVPEASGITPQVNVNVFYRNGSLTMNGLLAGVDVEGEDQLFEISRYVTHGSWEALARRSDGIVLGEGLAERLGIGMDDPVTVLTGDEVSRTYRVVGLLRTSISGVDQGKAFVSIDSARSLVSENRGYATDVQMNLYEYNSAEAISQRLGGDLEFKVESWQESNGQLEAGSLLRDIIALSVSLTILLVAGFGIYNIMNMTVNEKIREIAILKAMGYNGRDILEIFLAQSMVVGAFGGLCGLVLGYAVSYGVNRIPFEIAGLSTLPMDFAPRFYVQAFLFGLVTTLIAGYLPAKKASQVDPVSIIRS